MYDELVKSLRICADGEHCDQCAKWDIKQNGGRNACEYAICTEAADAVEELSKTLADHDEMLHAYRHVCNGLSPDEVQKKLFFQDMTLAQALEPYIQLFQPRWIPVTERLPEQFKPVLVYYNRNGYSGTGVAEYYHDGDTKVWRGCGFIPTHWMPLPEPPKEERA